MIRVGNLVWTLFVSLIVSLLSVFYHNQGHGGYPLGITFVNESGQTEFIWSVFFGNTVIWWILFSILLVVIKNYLLEPYSEREKVQKHSESAVKNQESGKEESKE